ncbi:NADH(P)-binding-domain-containing protein [Coemansia spiralis]|nr:NADH(P)-binding-domain-containing protein [Coemansia spiralis]
MHIAILGATRNVGKAFVEQAISKEDTEITILVRNPEKLTYTEEQLSKIAVVKGDALVKDDVVKTIGNADIVLFTLGARIGILKTAPDTGIESVGAQVVIDAIKEKRAANPPRFIMVSSTGAGGLYDVPYLLRPLYIIALHTPHNNKAVAEDAIKKSSIPFTIVRPALFTNGETTKKYRAGLDVSGYTISRSDLAHFILEECVIEGKYRNESPSIAY